MPKLFVTHKNPHLDDVAAIWVLRRALPVWKRARVEFVAADASYTRKDTADRIAIGVGRGQFDEHKGDRADSATTLVWKYCKKQPECVLKTPEERRAMDALVAYVNEEDHGMLFASPTREFMIGSVFTYLGRVTGEGSEGALQFGEQYLAGVYEGLLEKEWCMRDWKKRKEFNTPWGKGVSVTTTVSSKVVARIAYEQDYVLFVYSNPATHYLSIKSRNDSRVDLSGVATAVRSLEPDADWYLHHSYKMLICGSDVSANRALSSLSSAQLVALLQHA